MSSVNIDEFIEALLFNVEKLPTRDLEPCDLGNEIGRTIAILISQGQKHEFSDGIKHGLTLDHSGRERAFDEFENALSLPAEARKGMVDLLSRRPPWEKEESDN